MNETAATYRMNPTEDRIIFGDELTEGMWVLQEDPMLRRGRGSDEDAQIRAQRFRRITRLSHERGEAGNPNRIVFVGEWVDGYQEVHRYAVTFGWLVKKDDASETTPDES